MSIGISPIGRYWLGLGYAGFKLFTYAAGTTTKQNTFTDSTGATPNTNPIILDANGSAAVFLTQELLYKFVVASPTDSDPPTSPVWTQDNIADNIAVNSSYTPPGTGAVATTVAVDLNYQLWNIMRFGGDPTGANDNTAAIALANATGHPIYFPTGTYKVTGNTINITAGMIGDGAYNTNILTSDNSSNDIFVYTGNTAPIFQGIQFIHANTTKPAGFCITIVGSHSGAGTGEVSAARILHCEFNNYSYQVNFKRASLWSVIGSNFYNYANTAVYVDNQNNGDSGDAAFHGCVFFAGNSTGFGVQQVSSGGIKVQGCKFNGGGVGYLLNLGNIVGGSGTADLMINGNSFENMTFSGIQLQLQGGATSTFGNVEICGNQMYVITAGQFAVSSNDSSGFLSKVVLTGNVVTVNGAAGGFLFDYINGLYIGDNLIVGSGGATSGIQTGAHNTNANIGLNQINGFTYSVNPGAGTSVFKGDIQTGTTSAVCSTGYGTDFSGNATITFPIAYEAAISSVLGDFSLVLSNATGGIGYTVSAISNSGATVQLISNTNGATVNATWTMRGVL